MEHTKQCLERQATLRAEQAAYDAQYPNYCRACHGAGGKSYTENVGERNNPVYETGFDVCADCLEQGKCPRCGVASFLIDAADTCDQCGYVMGTTAGRPDFDEPCECAWRDAYQGMEY